MHIILRALMLLLLAWVAGLVVFVMTLPGVADEDIVTDGIVVLTGGPGRVARGIQMLRAGKAKRLLISGVYEDVRPVDLAAELNVPEAVFTCCVDLGKRAADTRGNGEEVALWAREHDYTSLRIVTSQFHMARANNEISLRTGRDVQLVADAVPDTLSPKAVAMEYSKYLVRAAQLLLGMG